MKCLKEEPRDEFLRIAMARIGQGANPHNAILGTLLLFNLRRKPFKTLAQPSSRIGAKKITKSSSVK